MHRNQNNPFTHETKHLEDLFILGEQLIKKSPGKSVKVAAAELAAKYKVSESYVKTARQFAETYDAEDFEELLALRMPNTTPLGTGHVFELLRINDRNRRKELQKLIVQRDFSVQQLKDYLDGPGKRKFRPNTKRGRKRKVPTTVKEALAKLSQRSDAWLTAANDLKSLFEKTGVHSWSLKSPQTTCFTALEKAIAAIIALGIAAKDLRKEVVADDEMD